MAEKRSRKRRQQEREDQDVAIEGGSGLQFASNAVAQTQDHTELEMSIALSLTEVSQGRFPTATPTVSETTAVVADTSRESSKKQLSKRDIFNQEEVKRLTRELHIVTGKLKKAEGLIDELKLHLRTAREINDRKPLNGSFLRTDKHKRHRGKKLTDEERRSVLHCLELCKLEKNEAKVVSTADPCARTATYLGLSKQTIKDAFLERNTQDLRAFRGKNKDAAAGNEANDSAAEDDAENVAEYTINNTTENNNKNITETENTTATEGSTVGATPVDRTITGNSIAQGQQPLPTSDNHHLLDQYGVLSDQHELQFNQYGMQSNQYGIHPTQYDFSDMNSIGF